MARTWPVTRRKKLLLGALDAFAAPLAAIRRRDAPADEPVEKILVLELWHMGDVVLVTPVLQRLRAIYPGARITLLAREHARALLENSGLVVLRDGQRRARAGRGVIAHADQHVGHVHAELEHGDAGGELPREAAAEVALREDVDDAGRDEELGDRGKGAERGRGQIEILTWTCALATAPGRT